jgi:hypothetical protein
MFLRRRDRHARLADELHRLLVHADHRAARVVGFSYVSSTSSMLATNSPSASGGITQYSIFRLVMPFF